MGGVREAERHPAVAERHPAGTVCGACGARRYPTGPVPVRDVGVDLDGVMYNFVAQLAAYAHRRGMFPDGAPNVHVGHYDFWRTDWGWSKDTFLTLGRHSILRGDLFTRGEPYPGAVHGWRRLAAAGHRLHVVTDRRWPQCEAEAEAATRSWLTRNGLQPHTVTFTADKTVILDVAHNPETVVVVEDSAANAALLESAGVETWLVDRPWNSHHPTRRRVQSMGVFSERVQAGRCACQ